MCLISEAIESVSDTKIFCGVNSEKTRQFTVYCNQVNNISENNAMVLPVPFPNTVEFHDLSNYKNFFTDCKIHFTKMRRGGYFSASLGTYTNSALQVYDIGSYKVSLAMNLEDIQRVDTNVFSLSNGLNEFLTKNYNHPNFGFIICKLAKRKEKYHPFAYSHNIFNEKVFIPTKHYHEKHKQPDVFSSSMFVPWQNYNTKEKYDNDTADDWSHDIYLYNVKFGDYADKIKSSIDHYNGEILFDYSKLGFELDKNCKKFSLLNIEGSNPNIDIILSCY